MPLGIPRAIEWPFNKAKLLQIAYLPGASGERGGVTVAPGGGDSSWPYSHRRHPKRLLIASALTYGGVFALLLAFGRPGLGIGEGFFVPVILATTGRCGRTSTTARC